VDAVAMAAAATVAAPSSMDAAGPGNDNAQRRRLERRAAERPQ
jgi:hypothetical protein